MCCGRKVGTKKPAVWVCLHAFLPSGFCTSQFNSLSPRPLICEKGPTIQVSQLIMLTKRALTSINGKLQRKFSMMSSLFTNATVLDKGTASFQRAQLWQTGRCSHMKAGKAPDYPICSLLGFNGALDIRIRGTKQTRHPNPRGTLHERLTIIF